MELREIIIWLGLVAIAVIVWDGVRRMKTARKTASPANDKKDYDPEELARKAQIERELPNGGARVREMTEDEKSQIENRLNLRERVPMLMERVEVDPESVEQEEPAAVAGEQAEMDFTAVASAEEIEAPDSVVEAESTDAADSADELESFGPAEKIEPFFGEELVVEELENKEKPVSEVSEVEESVSLESEEEQLPLKEEAEPETEAAEAAPVEDLVIMNVMASEDSEFAGSDILELLLASGLRHGPMDIFHYRNPEGKTEFSLANCVQPGVFNPDNMSQMTTPGLTLFLQLPTTADTMESFEHMHEMAQFLARKLGGDVRDEDHNAVTAQRCEFYREKLRNFVRSKLLPTQ